MITLISSNEIKLGSLRVNCLLRIVANASIKAGGPILCAIVSDPFDLFNSQLRLRWRSSFCQQSPPNIKSLRSHWIVSRQCSGPTKAKIHRVNVDVVSRGAYLQKRNGQQVPARFARRDQFAILHSCLSDPLLCVLELRDCPLATRSGNRSATCVELTVLNAYAVGISQDQRIKVANGPKILRPRRTRFQAG